jgi:hypothetical protein
MELIDPRALPRVFYERTRDVYLNEREGIDFTLDQLVEMAGDVSAQLELTRRVREGQNDPHFRELLILFLEKAADDLEEAAGAADDSADLLDRAGLTPSIAITTGAIAAIVATGGAVIPILVLAGGAVGLGALGVGRTALKAKSRRQKAGAKKLRSLAERLRTKP